MSHITRRRFVQTAGIAAAAPSFGGIAARAQSAAGADIQIEHDIVFGRGGDIDLRLDVYHPLPGTEKRIATVHIHGGGFTGGNKESVTRAAPFYAQLGYVGVASQYRLSGQARWPSQIHDVKAAIRWTRANADRLNIDPDRIAISGYSAGGFLALFAAATQDNPEFEGDGGTPGVSTRLAACVGYYPAIGEPRALLPENISETERSRTNLRIWMDAGFPPTVLFQGTADTVVPLASTQGLFDRLRDLDVPAELHTFDGQPHLFDRDPEFARVCAELADLFYGRNIGV